LISSFRRVLYVVCFLLGSYPASGHWVTTQKKAYNPEPTGLAQVTKFHADTKQYIGLDCG